MDSARRRAVAALLLLGLAALGACSASGQASPAPDATPTSGGSATAAPARAQVAGYARYVALGDSYTAAPKVPPADSTSPSCFRSTANYPHLVAASLAGAQFADRSCSAAVTADVSRRQQTFAGPVPPQINAVDRRTDLVTIGLGGNDSDVFSTLVGYCPSLRASDPTGSPCRDAMRAGGSDRLLAALAGTRDSLVGVVRAVRARAPEARVVLIGYPQITPESDTCPKVLPLARGDYAYGRLVNDRLNRAVQQAARATGADFVDVAKASAGHDICSGSAWVNGATEAPDALQFHPFAVEQSAVADLVLAAIG